ncbi:MAG: hypothetical protein ACI4QX_01065 [Lachnospiraceae bacterium]
MVHRSTELQNDKGDNIIIPVKIDGKGTYNDVYIDENQILSAYGKKNLKDYLDRNNFELIYTKKGTALNEGVQYPNISDSLNDTISQKESDVNSNYSLGDSDGRQLSAEQREYFKESRVRDEQGNLLVVYHQTDADFTEFDTRHEGLNDRAKMVHRSTCF